MPDIVGENTIEVVGADYPLFRHVSGVRDGLDLRYTPVGPGQAFKAVLENLPFQVNEFSLANYTLMRDRGVDWMIAIPVFLNRAFRHGSLYVRRDSDLTHPLQLRGKTIGAREYTQTAGVWWRGTMIDEYDLHWSDLNWVSERKQRFAPPDEARVEAVDGDLEQMVIDGAIDAFLAPSHRGRQETRGRAAAAADLPPNRGGGALLFRPHRDLSAEPCGGHPPIVPRQISRRAEILVRRLLCQQEAVLCRWRQSQPVG